MTHGRSVGLPSLLEDLMTAYENVVAEGARAILLRSSTRHFCVGAALQTFGTTSVTHTDKKRVGRLLDVMENIRCRPSPR
jgi:enoyl-CoA hydratase/carnithine racemase